MKINNLINKILNETKEYSNCWQYWNTLSKQGELTDCTDCYENVDIDSYLNDNVERVNLIFSHYGNEKNNNIIDYIIEKKNIENIKSILKRYENNYIKYYELIDNTSRKSWCNPDEHLQEFGLEIYIGDKMNYLNDKAINEIYNIKTKIVEKTNFLKHFGIIFNSDTWGATENHDNDLENLLSWNKEKFKEIPIDFNHFFISGSVMSAEYKYKNKFEKEPKELAEIKGKIFKKFLEKLVENNKTKYFTLKVYDDGLIEDSGWEHPMGIKATIKPNAFKKEKHLIDINGSLWVNSAKYEYVDAIIITEEEVLIMNNYKEIGCILRKNIKTLIEQDYENNIMVDLIENLIHLFDITKEGDM